METPSDISDDPIDTLLTDRGEGITRSVFLKRIAAACCLSALSNIDGCKKEETSETPETLGLFELARLADGNGQFEALAQRFRRMSALGLHAWNRPILKDDGTKTSNLQELLEFQNRVKSAQQSTTTLDKIPLPRYLDDRLCVDYRRIKQYSNGSPYDLDPSQIDVTFKEGNDNADYKYKLEIRSKELDQNDKQPLLDFCMLELHSGDIIITVGGASGVSERWDINSDGKTTYYSVVPRSDSVPKECTLAGDETVSQIGIVVNGGETPTKLRAFINDHHKEEGCVQWVDGDQTTSDHFLIELSKFSTDGIASVDFSNSSSGYGHFKPETVVTIDNVNLETHLPSVAAFLAMPEKPSR